MVPLMNTRFFKGDHLDLVEVDYLYCTTLTYGLGPILCLVPRKARINQKVSDGTALYLYLPFEVTVTRSGHVRGLIDT